MLGFDGGPGDDDEFPQVDRLIRLPKIQQFMAHTIPLRRGGFGGAHIHVAIELAGVHRQHSQIELGARSRARAVLPLAVGPIKAMTRGRSAAELVFEVMRCPVMW